MDFQELLLSCYSMEEENKSDPYFNFRSIVLCYEGRKEVAIFL